MAVNYKLKLVYPKDPVPCPDCEGDGLGTQRDVDHFDACGRCHGLGEVEMCPECEGNSALDHDDPDYSGPCDHCNNTGAEDTP